MDSLKAGVFLTTTGWSSGNRVMGEGRGEEEHGDVTVKPTGFES